MPKVVSPSHLARFYFHECERFLRFSSVLRDERDAEGLEILYDKAEHRVEVSATVSEAVADAFENTKPLGLR